MFTYRYRGHSVADANAEKYRDKAEIQEQKTQRDPIRFFREILTAEGHITEEQAKEIEKTARAEAEKSAEFADKSPYPTPESILEDTYWSLDNKGVDKDIDENNQGRIVFEDGGIYERD